MFLPVQDVDELLAQAEEIKSTQLLTTNIVGWPFGADIKVAADAAKTVPSA